jgi:hypothetical protein
MFSAVRLRLRPLAREAAADRPVGPVVLEAALARVVELRQALLRRQELHRRQVPAESAPRDLRLPLNR